MPTPNARKFEQFHRENPHVYQTLVSLARRWVARTGRQKLAIASLFEVARWEVSLSTKDPDYKLSNSYRAFYARLIMAQEPDLALAFNLKSSEADDWIAEHFAANRQLTLIGA